MATQLSTIPAGCDLEELVSEPTQWVDLGYDDGVVTFITISELLYEEWYATNQGHYSDERDFDIDEVTSVGAHREDEIYDTDNEKCYTVVVPYDFLAVARLEEYLEKLNDEYGTDFVLPESDNDAQ